MAFTMSPKTLWRLAVTGVAALSLWHHAPHAWQESARDATPVRAVQHGVSSALQQGADALR